MREELIPCMTVFPCSGARDRGGTGQHSVGCVSLRQPWCGFLSFLRVHLSPGSWKRALGGAGGAADPRGLSAGGSVGVRPCRESESRCQVGVLDLLFVRTGTY